MSFLFYKRPPYVETPDGPISLSTCQKYVDRSKNVKIDIPTEISFENVIANKAMPVLLSFQLEQLEANMKLALLSPRLYGLFGLCDSRCRKSPVLPMDGRLL